MAQLHVLVYHSPLLSHLLGVAPSTFQMVYCFFRPDRVIISSFKGLVTKPTAKRLLITVPSPLKLSFFALFTLHLIQDWAIEARVVKRPSSMWFPHPMSPIDDPRTASKKITSKLPSLNFLGVFFRLKSLT